MYEDLNVTISLPTSAAWDRILGWFVNTGRKSVFDIAGDSTSWGNFINSQYTLTESAYSNSYGEYIDITETTPLVKAKGEKKKLKTGSSDLFCVNNIFDLAGNAAEWVLSNDGDDGVVYRGGRYDNTLQRVLLESQTSKYEEVKSSDYVGGGVGFRAAIFL